MKKIIDLNPELPIADKCQFGLSVYDAGYGIVVAVADDTDMAVMTASWYPGSAQGWHASIATRARDHLIELGVIVIDGEGNESLNLSKL